MQEDISSSQGETASKNNKNGLNDPSKVWHLLNLQDIFMLKLWKYWESLDHQCKFQFLPR